MHQHSELPPGTPVTLELIHAKLEHLVIVQALDSARMTRLEDTQDRFLDESRALKRIAHLLSTSAMRLEVARATAMLMPAVARFSGVVLGAFAGGFAAQLLFHLLGIGQALASLR